MEFTIEQGEYIELKSLLKVTGLCMNGGEAKAAISEGAVKVEGKVETRKACKIRPGQKVEFLRDIIYVL